MPSSLPPLPGPLQTTLRPFRSLFHADTWPVFLCLLTGLLTGHTTLACARASLLCATVSWQPCCAVCRRARWSRAAFLRATMGLGLHCLYPDGLPPRRWWVVDTTTSDQPSARQVFGIRTFWRGCRRPGQTRTHQGHGWLLLAPLYQRPDRSWHAVLIGGRLWLQLRAAPPSRLTGALGAHLHLPPQVGHVVVSDRGLNSCPLVRTLRAQHGHRVTRLKRTTVVDTPADGPAIRGRGRPRTYGTKARGAALDHTLMPQTVTAVWVAGCWQPATAWRGTFWRKHRPDLLTIVSVETAGRAPW